MRPAPICRVRGVRELEDAPCRRPCPRGRTRCAQCRQPSSHRGRSCRDQPGWACADAHLVRRDEVTDEREDGHDDVLGDRDDVGARDLGDGDLALVGRVEVDVVRADTGGDAELEVLRLGDDLLGQVAGVEGRGDDDLGVDWSGQSSRSKADAPISFCMTESGPSLSSVTTTVWPASSKRFLMPSEFSTVPSSRAAPSARTRHDAARTLLLSSLAALCEVSDRVLRPAERGPCRGRSGP